MMEAPRSKRLLISTVGEDEDEDEGGVQVEKANQNVRNGSLGEIMKDLTSIEIPAHLQEPLIATTPSSLPSGREVDLDIFKMSIEHHKQTEKQLESIVKPTVRKDLDPQPQPQNPKTPVITNDSMVIQANNAPTPPSGNSPSFTPPPQPSGPTPGIQMMTPQTKKTGAIHLCAHCSEEVDIINGFETRDYKDLTSCGCYVHMACMIETHGRISCINCVCVGCDIPGAVTYRTGLQKNAVDGRLTEVTVYSKKFFACGCSWHQPCYDNFTKLKTEKQDRGLTACSFSKCIICLPDRYALGEMPPIFGPNYMKTHSGKELELYRALQSKKDAKRKVTRKREKEEARLVEKAAVAQSSSQEKVAPKSTWLTPVKPTQSSFPPSAAASLQALKKSPPKREPERPAAPAPESDSDSDDNDGSEGAAKVIVIKTPGDKGRADGDFGDQGSSIYGDTYGSRLYHTKMTLAHLNNMGFVLQDFANHLSPEQFFLRFLDVPIITKIIRVKTSSKKNGASISELLELWPSMSMNNIIGGIKGLRDRPPNKKEAAEESTRVVLNDLMELKLTTPLMIKMGLTAGHIVSTEPVALWGDAFPDLRVNTLGSWMDYPEPLLTAGLITEEECERAKVVNAEKDERMKVQNRSWVTSAVFKAYEMSPNGIMRTAAANGVMASGHPGETDGEEGYKNLTPSLAFNAKRRDRNGLLISSGQTSTSDSWVSSVRTAPISPLAARKLNMQPKINNANATNLWRTRKNDDL